MCGKNSIKHKMNLISKGKLKQDIQENNHSIKFVKQVHNQKYICKKNKLPITKTTPPKYKICSPLNTRAHTSTHHFCYKLPKATIKNLRVELVEKNSYTQRISSQGNYI